MLKFEPNHDLDRLPVAFPDGPYEIVDGAITEKPMSLASQIVGSKLQAFLGYYTLQHHLGHFVIETKFDFIEKKNRRCPDLAFVSFERWPKDKPVKTTDGWDVVPEICVEVISPSNTVNELDLKVNEYFGHGVSEVWIVNPELKTLKRFRGPAAMEFYNESDEFDGAPILPGLRLKLADVFPKIESDTDS
jgi:Uma2 family endonuclease